MMATLCAAVVWSQLPLSLRSFLPFPSPATRWFCSGHLWHLPLITPAKDSEVMLGNTEETGREERAVRHLLTLRRILDNRFVFLFSIAWRPLRVQLSAGARCAPTH